MLSNRNKHTPVDDDDRKPIASSLNEAFIASSEGQEGQS
jgi:hypothetical protein